MKTVRISLVSVISGTLFGYNVAVVAGALEFLQAAYGLSTIEQGALVSSILFGAFVGALASGHVVARWGERGTLMAASALFIVVPLLLGISNHAWLVGVFRALLGIGVGFVTMVAPLYVAECAPARRRGGLVSLFQFGVTAGILVAYLVNGAFTATGDWQTMFAAGTVPGLMLAAVLVGLPESPRWLAFHGRRDEARAALFEVQGAEADTTELDDQQEVPQGSWSDLFSPLTRGVLVMAAGLFLFQNLSGIDGILYYAPGIFDEVGFSGRYGAILATIGLGVVNLVATMVALACVDRLGRRPLLIGGLVVMTASLLVISVTVGDGGDDGMVTLIGLAVFIVAFAVSLGPLPYLLMSEVFPLSVRARGMSLASATSWALNLFVAMTFLYLLETLGPAGTFLIYAGVCACALVFSWYTVPETRGRTLAEIEVNLHRRLPLRQLGRPPETERP